MGFRLAAVLAAFFALAGTASAAELSLREQSIVFTAEEGERIDLTMRGSASSSPLLKQLTVIAADGSAPLTSQSPCSGNATTRSCRHRSGTGTATQLRLETAGGDDRIDASGLALPFDGSLPAVFETAGGADTLVGGPLFDDVFAGPGDDRVTGGPGDDTLRGEDGDDFFVGLDGDDTVSGGLGTDRLDLSGVAIGGIAVSLNGAPDDGPLGAEANIDVEQVTGTPSDDLLSGGPGPNALDGGPGNDVIDVRGGGADDVDCGPGADRVLADAEDAVADCETSDSGGPPPAVDADGDGVVAGVDCDDGDAQRRPGARDVPGNRIDEDCSGGDAELEVVPARIVFAFAAFRDGTEARALRVRAVPEGGRVQLRCSRERACGFLRRSARVRDDGTAGLLRFLRGKRLPVGLKVEVRVRAPEHITKVTRFVMRARKAPRKRSLCLAPGASRPASCA